jgi:hypothetical protein
MNITLNKMLEDLREGIVHVHFEKLNGEMRVGTFTLSSAEIPQQEEQKASSRLAEKLEKGEEIISLNVYEPGINDWRSFRLANVKNWNGEDVTYAGS